MQTLEVFFDYACPFCLRGHTILLELLHEFPEISVEWHPCEAHPRPEQYGVHSDLCARGMFCAQEAGVDLLEYHNKMYRAALTDAANIEDLDVVTQVVAGLLDSKLCREVLDTGKYADKLLQNNQLAWDTYQFPAIPSYAMNGMLLKSIGGVGITKQRLQEFLELNGALKCSPAL